MGRWAQLDSDEERLPEHFKRIGYDADTQTYTFLDTSTGRHYESSSGNRYGVLHPVGQASSSPRSSSPSVPTDPKRLWEEIDAHNEAVRKQNTAAVRLMLPFALLVLAFLLLVFKFVNGGAGADEREQVRCADGYQEIQVQEGETCWAIGEARGLGVEELLKIEGNEGVDCDKLGVGQAICVPA